jgi:transcriptional regulator with XRE-family HTH domain
MKLGDVLKKEREKKGASPEEAAEKLGVSVEDYNKLESGESDVEKWAPLLAEIAIKLETPTSRLISETGRAEDAKAGQSGKLIQQHRERRELSADDLAEGIGVSKEEYAQIEAGDSPLEQYGPQVLAFAELIEQPVFNLFYPCGLPFQELDDYP